MSVWCEQPFCFIWLIHCSYLQYSSICARLLRRSLKPELREAALKREESGLKVTRWEQGKPTADTSELMSVIHYDHSFISYG